MSYEFMCSCGCGQATVQPELVEKLQQLRDEYGRAIVITSGFRCKDHNKAVGGKPDSAHTRGEGADIECVSSANRFELLKAALRVGFERIGIDKGFIHVDVANRLPKPRIWTY